MDIQGRRKLRIRKSTRPTLNSNLSQDDVIQKNLEPLKQNIQKKIRAQEAYYQNCNNVSVSPMTHDIKPPVQQRLGRKVPFTGTNTSMVPPKKRLYKNTLNSSILKKKHLKRNHAQIRLNKIREKQRYESMMANNLTGPRKIKIHGRIPNAIIPNFKVQIRNNGNITNNGIIGYKRHKISLDSEIQIAIKQLETLYTGEKIVILKVKPKATTISLNDRFTNLD
ncbi:uncharacterized protein LOC130451398 [Diorhabda sublineata]|uniref:uncharacterized protein LOC130451398 n=1 Tax=Diorhabda sublineata TaxID=1163346 RepID=UPI0024E0D080|nr:uncharacterized protein LOC130451398 [Diorhabda sublineata]